MDIAATLAQIPALYLTRSNHLKTRRSSSILLLFWPIYTLFTAIWTRTVVSSDQQPHDNVKLGLRWLYVGTGLIFFVIECLGSESYSELPSEHGRQESPFVTANIFQR
jgi:ATP-binding cassette subfamily C (CFTR/MRP) protein 1